VNYSQHIDFKPQAQLKVLHLNQKTCICSRYIRKNTNLCNTTYPVYFQWWHRYTYSEQYKAEKDKKDSTTFTFGLKGTDELVELKQSIENSNSAVI